MHEPHFISTYSYRFRRRRRDDFLLCLWPFFLCAFCKLAHIAVHALIFFPVCIKLDEVIYFIYGHHILIYSQNVWCSKFSTSLESNIHSIHIYIYIYPYCIYTVQIQRCTHSWSSSIFVYSEIYNAKENTLDEELKHICIQIAI